MERPIFIFISLFLTNTTFTMFRRVYVFLDSKLILLAMVLYLGKFGATITVPEGILPELRFAKILYPVTCMYFVLSIDQLIRSLR